MKYAPAISSIIAPAFLAEWVKNQYALATSPICKVLRLGVNHTYLVQSSAEQYVLRVYTYGWRTETEILAEIELLNLLKQNAISVAFPIQDKNGYYLQKINAREGLRYAVLFSFAKGISIRNPAPATCYQLGIELAKMHQVTEGIQLQRKNYDAASLIGWVFPAVEKHFGEAPAELQYIKSANDLITAQFHAAASNQLRKGMIHLDIWSDNMKVQNDTEITLFDFDNCGYGWLCLDIAYAVLLLFNNEKDKTIFQKKLNHFYQGYESITTILPAEKQLLPYGGLAIWLHYTGIHVQRFDDFSNFFFNKNFLKQWLQVGDHWMDYNGIKI